VATLPSTPPKKRFGDFGEFFNQKRKFETEYSSFLKSVTFWQFFAQIKKCSQLVVWGGGGGGGEGFSLFKKT
jgi:hypothetical protein